MRSPNGYITQRCVGPTPFPQKRSSAYNIHSRIDLWLDLQGLLLTDRRCGNTAAASPEITAVTLQTGKALHYTIFNARLHLRFAALVCGGANPCHHYGGGDIFLCAASGGECAEASPGKNGD